MNARDRAIRIIHSRVPLGSDPDDEFYYQPLRDAPLAVDGNLYPPKSKLPPQKDGEFEEFVDCPPSTTKLKHTSTAGGLRQDRPVDGDEPGTLAASVTNYYSGKRVSPSRGLPC